MQRRRRRLLRLLTLDITGQLQPAGNSNVNIVLVSVAMPFREERTLILADLLQVTRVDIDSINRLFLNIAVRNISCAVLVTGQALFVTVYLKCFMEILRKFVSHFVVVLSLPV
jgi:hypothetical protein